MKSYDTTIRFTSDWMVGSGSARHASVDRLVRRDTDGLAYLPGKTVRGLLREASGRAARALDDGVTGPDAHWTHLHQFLFGRPGHAGVISVPSARLPDGVRAALATDVALRDATVLLRASTALDESGRARHDSLRLEERALQGAVLSTTLVVDAPTDWFGENDWAVELLLYAASTLITRIGGKRRRGVGRCSVHIADLTAAVIADTVNAYRFTPPAMPGAGHRAEAAPQGDGLWRRFWVTITTRDPVMIADRALGNTMSGRSYIPGTMLLALLTQRVGGAVRSAVAAGDVIVTDATPFNSDNSRGLPVPRSVTVPKTVVADEVSALDSLRRGPPPGIQYVPLTGYLDTSAALTVLDRVPGTISLTHVDVTGSNSPFTYDALQPDARLRAEIWTRVPLDVAGLAGSARLGASRRTEYGGVDITVAADTTAGSAERSAVHPDQHQGSLLSVWLTSDLLLPLVLATADTVRLALQSALECSLSLQGAALTTQRRESWHSGWGLPQPSQALISAGAVLALTVDGEITGARLSDIEATGLGVRRAEGYGRLLFNPPVLTASGEQTVDHVDAQWASPLTAQPIDDVFVTTVRELAAVRAIGDAAIVIAADEALRSRLIPRWPGDSAAGDLRRVLERLTRPGGGEAAATWVQRISDSQLRTRQWDGWEHLAGWFREPRTFVDDGAPGRGMYRRVGELLATEDPGQRWPAQILQIALLTALAAARTDHHSRSAEQEVIA